MNFYEKLFQFIRSIDDHGLQFLFSSGEKNNKDGAYWLNTVSIKTRLKDSIYILSTPENEDIQVRLLQEFPETDNYIDIGQRIINIEDFMDERPAPENVRLPVKHILDVLLAYKLLQIVMDKDRTAHPQNLRHILSYFQEKKPELLLIIKSLLIIIPDQDHFAIEERFRAGRLLVNNYRIETIFIYTSLCVSLDEARKEYVFSWLTSFQKVYRKIHEILFEKQKDKTVAAKKWFGNSITKLKKEGKIPKADHQIPGFLKKFIECFISKQHDEMARVGRCLLIAVKNEDILRIMHRIIHENITLSQNKHAVINLYHEMYTIMNEYRMICTEQQNSVPVMETTLAFISRQTRESEAIVSSEDTNKTLILGIRTPHKLLDETKKNLYESSLQHLFEIWPIPSISQEVFNTVCKLKTMIPGDKNHLISHFLYREKLLEFLMRLERVGIKIVRKHDLPLITNAVQLNIFGLIKKGLYLGSTGHWNSPNHKPPSIICFTKPNAIGNCLGQPLRHIVLRVFLATGEFYESPFVLDSTQRYGQIEEESSLDSLLIHPGLFFVDIPPAILVNWGKKQQHQLNVKLGSIIEDRIRIESSL